ncbi:hypothetical protein N799_12440 [Lysobacter arseniciresistens ZS79]|uniref:DUF418 domain-containing protein n=1 Tax=Lysobacter arseniciresistens ZS79 TaxID=913325 RepID=A0A0A0F2H0_9GAMM|nr:DUF418 domain-containing protein [Lysobacter arseniciresistens]KGM57004.1 hypothetical protein N799_12440 [Lysobacter arseniciresistens ZS79]
MTTMTLAPVSASERIDNLDVLRGLALLGIALMNVEYFTAPMADMGSGIAPGATGLDWLADAFVHVFVRGKFWTLFSLLFGMGFAVMLGRARAAGRDFVPVYLRRTAGLLAIGLVHALLVWAGDILVSYAVTALLLVLLFRDTDTARLWKWGAGIWGVMVGLMLLGSLAMMAPGAPVEDAGVEAMAALREAETVAYATGSYAEATAVRLQWFVHSLGSNFFLVPLVLGMFLAGAWLVRSGAMADPAAHRRLFMRLAWMGGLAGLALTANSVAVNPDPDMVAGSAPDAMLAMTLHMAGAPLLALGYTGMVVLALQRGAGWLRVLAPAGRMALTNYLAQSAIGTLVFYGYGLGLWGGVPRSWQVLGVVVVFGLQLLASRWWLARFRYGPLEWAWRAFTYWQWPPMRRPPVPAAARAG